MAVCIILISAQVEARSYNRRYSNNNRQLTNAQYQNANRKSNRYLNAASRGSKWLHNKSKNAYNRAKKYYYGR